MKKKVSDLSQNNYNCYVIKTFIYCVFHNVLCFNKNDIIDAQVVTPFHEYEIEKTMSTTKITIKL